MNASRSTLSALALGLSLAYLPSSSTAEKRIDLPQAPAAARTSRVTLPTAKALPTLLNAQMAEETLFCFDSLLTAVINPGCFNLPGTGGDCSSSATHFLVQLLDPFETLGDFEGHWRVKEVAFISNDGDTVWPSVGIVRVPFDPIRFPTTEELQNLQVTNVASPGDTSEVVVDLRDANCDFTVDDVLFMVVQFPEGGVLTAPLQGPGVLADEKGANPECNFLTQDTGTTWASPSMLDPLGWGFAVVVEQVVAVEERSWGDVKLLYQLPSAATKRRP